jgi:hypothetical protein
LGDQEIKSQKGLAMDLELILTDAIKAAEKEQSKLPQSILKLDGMSSPKNRHLLNNLCMMDNSRYLEIGVWKGSTFISALLNNECSVETATGIDNWSEFGGPISEFEDNCRKYLPDRKFVFINNDCFKVPKETLERDVNIYFYDGNHTLEATCLAFIYYYPILADEFIMIVDDWNHEDARKGTNLALQSDLFEIKFKRELISPHGGEWWNGLLLMVLKKKWLSDRQQEGTHK